MSLMQEVKDFKIESYEDACDFDDLTSKIKAQARGDKKLISAATSKFLELLPDLTKEDLRITKRMIDRFYNMAEQDFKSRQKIFNAILSTLPIMAEASPASTLGLARIAFTHSDNNKKLDLYRTVEKIIPMMAQKDHKSASEAICFLREQKDGKIGQSTLSDDFAENIAPDGKGPSIWFIRMERGEPLCLRGDFQGSAEELDKHSQNADKNNPGARAHVEGSLEHLPIIRAVFYNRAAPITGCSEIAKQHGARYFTLRNY